MSAFLVSIALVMASTGVHSPLKWEDGFYEVVGQKHGKEITATDGNRLFLGRQLKCQSDAGTMISSSNNNDHFQLQMPNCKFEPSPKSLQFALVLDGRCFRISGSTSQDEPTNYWLHASFLIDSDADQISEFVKIEKKLRRHPGYQIQTTCKPVGGTLEVGKKKLVEISIRNTGDTVIRFMNGGQQRGARNNQFRFIAFSSRAKGRALPDIGDPLNFGGLAAFVNLRPGEVFTAQADLSNWFEIDQADSISLTCLFQLEMYADQNFHQVIWDDFAVATCSVQIK